MSPELINLFDAFTDGLEKKDLNRIVNLFAEDAAYIVYAQGYRPVSGKRAIRAFMEDELKKIKEYSVEKLFICEKKNCIVIEWRVRFKDASSEKKFEIQGVSIIDAMDGLIHHWREYIQS